MLSMEVRFKEGPGISERTFQRLRISDILINLNQPRCSCIHLQPQKNRILRLRLSGTYSSSIGNSELIGTTSSLIFYSLALGCTPFFCYPNLSMSARCNVRVLAYQLNRHSRQPTGGY